MNEPTSFNLEEHTPDVHFVDVTTNLKEEVPNRELIKPFKKGILGDIIAEVFKHYKISETSKMLDKMKDLGLNILLKLVLQSVYLTLLFYLKSNNS